MTIERLSLLVILLFASACGDRTPQLRITVASGILEPFPVYLCQDLGLFRAEGITATIEALPGGKGLEALMGGSADVRYNSASEVVQAAVRGKRLKVFFVGQRTLSSLLVVSTAKAGRIRSIEDLRGSVVGVAAFGGAQHMFLNFILEKHGLGAGDVQVIAHGSGSPAIAALEHGKVDAGMINGSAFTALRGRAPGVRVLLDPRTLEATRSLIGSADYVNFALLSTSDWIARNPDTARRLARAMKKTLAWIRERSAEEVLAKLPEHLRSADAGADLESMRIILGGMSEDGLMPPGGPEVLRRMLGVPIEKLREQGIELSQTYTNEFVPHGQ
ncbi:MAG: ABC transporter substrate-binding protein [Bryobacteraceae bacterium]